MNTIINYMYRDGSNYKQFASFVVEGKLDIDVLFDCCDDGEYFIPYQVGLPELQEQAIGFPNEDDHVWHTLEEIEFTNDQTTLAITAEQLQKNFEEAKGKWNVAAAMKRLGLS
jgi:hypothetical protein